MLQTAGPKQQIIDVLSSEFPLTAKKVYNVLKKRYQIGSTYIAVYQHMQELVGQGVVVKEGLEYRLDGKWIRNTRAAVESMENNYESAETKTKEAESIKLLTFRNQKDMFAFLATFRQRFFDSAKSGDEVLWLGNHTWGPLFYMATTVAPIKEAIAKGIKFYIAMRGDTSLDRAMVRFYKRIGIEDVMCGTEPLDNRLIYIYGDTMLFIEDSHDFSVEMSEIFKCTERIEEMDLANIYEQLMRRGGMIQVMIIRNPDLVKKYINYIKSIF